MAERLKTKLLETDKKVDLVAGPGMCDIPFRQLKIISTVYHLVTLYHDVEVPAQYPMCACRCPSMYDNQNTLGRVSIPRCCYTSH